MKIIIINEKIGANCITLEDGQQIYDAIYPELSAGKPVELDFDKVKIFASPFFNSAIGRLLKDIEPDALNRLLVFKNLNPDGMVVLKRVIENSKQYYSNENTRKTIDEILLAQGEDQ
ncbi:MAG: STAS-like domain-containing protein [Desulfobulbaceae bacterium]|nr:STAS-like domain-containing protein [Desulfobulbaceae bacterium]